MLGFLRKLTSGRSAPARDAIVLRERDCHCHVIPGVDDGSRSIEESLQMLELLADAGAKTVVATPHIFPGRFPNEPEPLRRAFEALVRARDEAGLEVQLELGAEHYLDDSMLARVEAGNIVAFGSERYVLFETTTGVHAPPSLMEVAFALVARGYTPLMAHVERYHYLRDDEGKELCEDLRAAGVRFQVNRTVGKANLPGRGPRGEFIAWLVERDWIDEVGSDLHRPTPDGRPYAMPGQPHAA